GHVAAGLDFPNSASNADTLLMLRNALVMERLKDNIEIGDIDLLRGAPRAWLESGKPVRLSRMPTYFGEVSMEATGDRAGVRATIDVPPRSARLLLHIRHSIKSATVNGALHEDCDFEQGIVRLPAGSKRYQVEVRY